MLGCIVSFVLHNLCLGTIRRIMLLFPPTKLKFLVTSKNMSSRACLHEGGGPQVGEVTCGGLPHLSCKRDHIKMRDYMVRWVTPPKRVTSPIWGPPPPCKQALKCSADYTMINDDRLGSVIWDHSDHGRSNEPMGIHSEQGFIGSFDPQWSKWSRITYPDPDHPKGTHP